MRAAALPPRRFAAALLVLVTLAVGGCWDAERFDEAQLFEADTGNILTS